MHWLCTQSQTQRLCKHTAPVWSYNTVKSGLIHRISMLPRAGQCHWRTPCHLLYGARQWFSTESAYGRQNGRGRTSPWWQGPLHGGVGCHSINPEGYYYVAYMEAWGLETQTIFHGSPCRIAHWSAVPAHVSYELQQHGKAKNSDWSGIWPSCTKSVPSLSDRVCQHHAIHHVAQIGRCKLSWGILALWDSYAHCVRHIWGNCIGH